MNEPITADELKAGMYVTAWWVHARVTGVIKDFDIGVSADDMAHVLLSNGCWVPIGWNWTLHGMEAG